MGFEDQKPVNKGELIDDSFDDPSLEEKVHMIGEYIKMIETELAGARTALEKARTEVAQTQALLEKEKESEEGESPFTAIKFIKANQAIVRLNKKFADLTAEWDGAKADLNAILH